MKNKKLEHIMRKFGMDTKFNKSLSESEIEFEKRTKNVEDDYDLVDFFQLLQIAEYKDMGKTKAILYAYKLGYLQGEKQKYFNNEVTKND